MSATWTAREGGAEGCLEVTAGGHGELGRSRAAEISTEVDCLKDGELLLQCGRMVKMK